MFGKFAQVKDWCINSRLWKLSLQEPWCLPRNKPRILLRLPAWLVWEYLRKRHF